MKQCCDTMRREAERVSARPADEFGRRPDCLVYYGPKLREYALFDHDRSGPHGVYTLAIYYCPWCGARLPEGLRERWFAELAAMGVDPNGDDVPADYWTSAWWEGGEASAGRDAASADDTPPPLN